MPALTLKVFISSPGDVGQERVVATHVLERIRGAFGGLVELEPILWEHEPLRATSHFQDQIPPPSESDIVVCILWSRLGTRLPSQFVREDGTHYSSGTEWEFEDAVRAHRETGRPDLLVYRKTAEPLAGLSDRKAILDRLEQKEALDAFIDHWFGNPYEAFRAAFHQIQSPEHFEDLLETHLTKLIHKHLPDHHVDEEGQTSQRTWYDNPYRGLQVFDVEHAGVFSGRTRAIGEIRQALLRQAAENRAFVVVFGMSGCGKSSTVRAGLLPTIAQPGVIEGIGLWRWGIFRPSAAAGDLLDGLAQSLLGPNGLPELEAVGQDAGELAALFREAPKRTVAPIKAALEKAAEKVAADERLPRPPAARLAVVVDQMEEIFTLERVDVQQRERFVDALSALARSGHVWVIATMRSDFYPRCAEVPELIALKEGDGQYDLRPPSFAEIGQMIRHPTRAAGLHFEVNHETGERLDDVLHEAAARDPEALPLLEFTLDELYKQRTKEDVLTFAAHEQLGGLEGALARRAEEVLSSLDPPAQEALPSLLRALVTAGHGEGDVAASRRVLLSDLDAGAACRTLLDAFIEARLLVTDRADDGQPVVGIAHEALLRHWPRLQKWLAEDREFLRTRDRVADAAANWRKEGKRPDLLLPDGKPLSDARDMLARRRADLRPELVEYIEESQSWASRGRQRRNRAAGAVTALLFSLVVGWGWSSRVKTRQLEDQRDTTIETVANLTDVPQSLQSLNNRDSIRVMGAINKAIEETLRQVPDAPRTRRAKAVERLLQAEILRREGDQEAALRAAREAVNLGTELVNDKHNSRMAKDQRNLASFYSAQGRALGDLWVSTMEDRYYRDALVSYDQCRRHAELASNDAGAQQATLNAYFGTVMLQKKMIEGSAGTPESRRDLEQTVAMAKKALDLAKERANRQPDDQTRSDLAACEQLVRQVQGLQRSVAGDKG